MFRKFYKTLISYISILKQKPTTITITNHTEIIKTFQDVAALTLLHSALKEQEHFYRNLYTKATKTLIDVKQKNTLAEIHRIVNTYHANLTRVENELQRIEILLKTYNQKVIKDYLNLDTKYDNN